MPNRGSDTVSVIDLDSFQLLKTISVGQDPRRVVIDDSSSRGYVVNYLQNSLTVLDLDQDEVITKIPLSGAPLGLVLSQDGRRIYVTLHNDHSLALIDANQLEPYKTLSLGNQPSDLALEPNSNSLYVVIGGENRVAILDSEELQEVGSIPVGENPQNIVLHPTLPMAYVTNFSSDSVSVISLIDKKVVHTIAPVITPNALAILPNGSKLLVTGDYQITVIDTTSHNVEKILYAPPSAQIRQGIVITETEKDFTHSGEVVIGYKRPFAYVTEKIYFNPPPPFNITISIDFPTKRAKPQQLIFKKAEVNNLSISLLPVIQKPKYYSVTFAFQIPIRVLYLDDDQSMQEYHDTIHHVASSVEIYLPYFNHSLKLIATAESQLLEKTILSPNQMELKIRTNIIALQQIHIKE